MKSGALRTMVVVGGGTYRSQFQGAILASSENPGQISVGKIKIKMKLSNSGHYFYR